MVRELIHHRMDTVGDEDEDGNTPLHLACIKGYPGVARVLLIAKADVEARSLSVCFTVCACDFCRIPMSVISNKFNPQHKHTHNHSGMPLCGHQWIVLLTVATNN